VFKDDENAACFKWLVAPKAVWKESSFLKMYGLIYDGFSKPYFFLLDYAVAVAVGIVSGWSASCDSSSSCCQGTSITVTVIVVFYTVATFIFIRPFLARYDEIISALTSLSLCISSVLATAINFGVQDLESILDVLTTFDLVLLAFTAFFTVIPLLVDAYFWIRAKCASSRKTSKKFEKERKKMKAAGGGWFGIVSDGSKRLVVKKEKTKKKKKKNKKKEATTTRLEDLLLSQNDDDDEQELLEIVLPSSSTANNEQKQQQSKKNKKKKKR
jgi:hypothetical protein